MKNNYLRNVLFASLILIANLGFAQMDSQLEWSKLYGGSDWDKRLYSSKPTLNGGIITIGRAGSTNGFVHGWRGQDDIFVLLLDAQGDTIWTRTYGGAYRDYGKDIVQTPDSNFAHLIFLTTN